METSQLDIFTPSRSRTPVEIAQANASQFSLEFLEWLPINAHIWYAFENEALNVIERGYKHYSSRTIIEFLRHHSTLEEVEGEFKINNNIQPYLPRLFDLTYPSRAGLFEYRVTTKEKGIA
jgi:hypothetical protein